MSNNTDTIDKVYKKSGIQKAIEACQARLLDDPTNAKLHVRLGDLYLEWHLDIAQAKSYIEEAITEYQKALESFLDSDEVYYKIGVAFYYKNEPDKAINYFETAIEKNPKCADAYYMIAECCAKKARLYDAMEYVEKIIKGQKSF